jgi:DNA-binding HxlR family transcriptional regulator
MPRLKANDSLCSAARALEILGARWTLLLLREAVFGTRRFDAFATHLGIARNVLASRLGLLVQEGLFETRRIDDAGLREEYRLTDKGRDTLPILIALLQWGDRWLQTAASIPVQVIDRRHRRALPRMRPLDTAGNALELRDLDWIPGPGASDSRMASLVAAYDSQRRPAPVSIPKAAERVADPLRTRRSRGKTRRAGRLRGLLPRT